MFFEMGRAGIFILILVSAHCFAAEPGSNEGEWRMPAKNFESTRFSKLDEINTNSVKDLKVKWTFSTGIERGQEAAPLVIGGTMYVVTPYPNILYALDLSQNGALKWKYEPKPEAAAQGVACCDVVNRGAVYGQWQDFLQHTGWQLSGGGCKKWEGGLENEAGRY